MAATTTTSAVYINVIEDVINKVREEFLQSGVDEGVLSQLQALWEHKMMECGAICGPIERSSLPKQPGPGGSAITPVHDLNVPYEGPEEYETPTADMLFPPTPLQTPIQTPLPGTSEHSMYHLPTPSDYPTPQDSGGVPEVKPGRPSPYMDFFVVPSGKRKREDFPPQVPGSGYIPQQDGAGDATYDVFQSELAHKEIIGPLPHLYIWLYPYQGVASEDYNTVNTPAGHELHAGTPAVVAPIEAGDDDDDEPPLNENDDDDLDDVEGEEPNTQHLVLAQFDKVTRTKSRWKCTLKDGIMHINSKDILFTKQNFLGHRRSPERTHSILPTDEAEAREVNALWFMFLIAGLGIRGWMVVHTRRAFLGHT
ncbi:hypothetical protein Syun_000489 [Stephania yunnanensis]|uniref:Uncharacterized protein n=1 Tax=Stephania yunnanensis TaxID=152371 RepID=A0AAP0LHN3_9MAGN